MDFKVAQEVILTYLQTQKGATNSKLIDLVEGDATLFERVKEYLIFKDLAEDKKGAGLNYIGPEKNNQDDNSEIIVTQNSNQNSESSSPKIFISYGRKDAEKIANSLLIDLKKLGYEVWLDKEQIRAGKSWEDEIKEAILSSEFFIALLTPHAVRRPDGVCLDEISVARYNNRRIIPIMVINCSPPLGIFRLDWLDLQDWGNPINYARTLEKIGQFLHSNEDEVEGIHAHIFGLLKPINFKLEIYRHVKDFTGREWILKVIREWVKHNKGELLIVTGDPGTGKTAIMSKLIHLLPEVGAYHFCIAKFESSLIPEKFIHSIASQLATQLPEYREILSMLNLQSLVYKESGALMKQLIIDPLSQIQREAPLVLIIDALDEALYHGNENIAKLLYNWLDDFPSWVKLVITSRKVPEILQMFAFYRPIELDVDSDDNRNDIKQYVVEMLSQKEGLSLSVEKLKDAAEKITYQSEGIFLYAKTVVHNLLNRTLAINEINCFPTGLSGVFQANFKRLFTNNERFLEVKLLLEIILAAYEPLSLDKLALFHGITPYEIMIQLNNLSEFFPENEGTYSAFHKSLGDWLTGRSNQRHSYLCDVAKGHTVISDILLRNFEENKPNEYTIQYLPKHLFYCGRYNEMQYLLNDFHYIEARASFRQVYGLIGDYKLYLSSIPRPNRIIDTKSITYLWDQERHLYETGLFISSLTPDKKSYIILDFLYRQAGLFQLYGNIQGFVKQQAYNEGLFPIVFNDDSRILKENHGFFFTDSFRKKFNPFPSVTAEFYEHKMGISDLSVSSDAQWLVSASFDRTVRLWNLTSGECIKSLKFNNIVETLVLAPDASFIAIAGAIADFCILLYDNKLDKILARLQGHMGRIMMMKLSQNNRMVSCSYDHKIIVWDLSNNTIIYRKDYNCELLVCSISDDGTTIAVSTSENLVEVWNIDLDLLILSLIHDKGELGALTLTSDCKELIIGGGKDKQTEVWDLISRTLMYSIDGHGTITYCLFVNRSKTILISAGRDRFLKIWDFRTGHLLKEFESHLRVTRRIAAADDANIVISGGGWNSDYNIRIWDVNRSFGTINKSNQAASIIAVMHSEINDCIIGVNRKNVFSINTTGERKVLKDKLSIRLVDRLNNNLYFPLNNGTVSKYQKDSGSWVDLFHNKDVVSAILPLSEDDWVIGDIKGNIVYKKNNEIKSYSRLSEFRIWQILTSNNYLVILDDNNQFYFIHKVSGKIDHTFKHYARLTSNVIVLNEDICFGDALGNITKLNLTDNTLQEISKAHESEITSILFLEKNRRIISGCSTGYIKIWNPDMTFCLLEFKGHESSVNFLCTSIDPYFLSAGGSHYSDPGIIKSDVKDTSLKKWNTYTGECVGVYPSNELITSINTDKTGLIIIGLRNGLIHEFYDQIIQPS